MSSHGKNNDESEIKFIIKQSYFEVIRLRQFTLEGPYGVDHLASTCVLQLMVQRSPLLG